MGVSEATAWRTTSDLSFERSEVVNARGQTRPATYARKPEPPPTMFDPGGSADLEPKAADSAANYAPWEEGETMAAAQRSTGAKYEHIPGVGRYGADPYGLAADALGLNVLGVWSNFDVRRPQEGIPQSPNPFALGLQNGGR